MADYDLLTAEPGLFELDDVDRLCVRCPYDDCIQAEGAQPDLMRDCPWIEARRARDNCRRGVVEPGMVTLAEASNRLGIKRHHLENLCRRGQLRCVYGDVSGRRGRRYVWFEEAERAYLRHRA